MFTIFKIFFALGCLSFGGPAAHIGYFKQAFVDRRKWLSDEEYAQIVALSQFLPGPGSSQVGFAIGHKKAGLGGAISAFVGFTLPSVLLMLLFVTSANQFIAEPVFQSLVHGLKLLAVVVVVDAIWGMFKGFCKDTMTRGLCIATAVLTLLMPHIGSQVLAIVVAALIGAKWLHSDLEPKIGQFQPSWAPLVIFLVLLIGLPVIAASQREFGLFNDFYQAGTLVFGGGHVVLPLLQNLVGEQLSQDSFITGYAAAQAVPGPMFTFATFLGYELSPNAPLVGALAATLAIFLPGFLLMLVVLNNWQLLASKPNVANALKGVNAAVVGLLLAALYQPVFVSAVLQVSDFVAVIIGLYLMKQIKLPIVYLVLLSGIYGVALSLA